MGDDDQGPVAVFRTRRGEITVSLSGREADLLRGLVREYLQVLESDDDDKVMRRLFPDASLDDDEVRTKYLELTRESLAGHKRAAAERALLSLGGAGPWKSALSEDERDAWLVLLTELRLVIGTRLDVTEETMSKEPDPNDPEQWPLAVMHYLGWLQETLVEASSPG